MVDCPEKSKGRKPGGGEKSGMEVYAKPGHREAWIESQPWPCGDTPRASYLPLSAWGCAAISKWLSMQKECKRSSVLILQPDFY